MEWAIAIWNFLWDNQVLIAVILAFILWMVLRGSDLVRWVSKKIRKKA